MKYTNLTYKAKLFAEKAHEAVEQVRKYTGDPYIVHPIAVAELLATVTSDEAVIAAALLHDTLEDTKVTEDEILEAFGEDVLQLVKEVTDVSKPSDGSRKIRKDMDRLHISRASPRGKSIKLADLINNTQSITDHDRDFARVYMREKERLLDVLVEGNPILWQKAFDIVQAYYATENVL